MSTTTGQTEEYIRTVMTNHGYRSGAITTYIGDAQRCGQANPIGPVSKIRYSRKTGKFSITIMAAYDKPVSDTYCATCDRATRKSATGLYVHADDDTAVCVLE